MENVSAEVSTNSGGHTEPVCANRNRRGRRETGVSRNCSGASEKPPVIHRDIKPQNILVGYPTTISLSEDTAQPEH